MIEGEITTIFERRPKTCAGCDHWNLYYRTAPEGYYQSVCGVEPDNRDHQIRRASDYCSRWKIRA